MRESSYRYLAVVKLRSGLCWYEEWLNRHERYAIRGLTLLLFLENAFRTGADHVGAPAR